MAARQGARQEGAAAAAGAPSRAAVERALAYGARLVGAPRPSSSAFDEVCAGRRGDRWPYWSADGEPPPPAVVRRAGTNCAGLANLLCRAAGGRPSALAAAARRLGDTRDWFAHLSRRGCLRAFRADAAYPRGTLLLRDYNPRDHGHLAVVFEARPGRSVLHARLLHSVGWDDGGPQQVRIDASAGRSHFFQYDGVRNTGHYTHACLPQDWLRPDNMWPATAADATTNRYINGIARPYDHTTGPTTNARRFLTRPPNRCLDALSSTSASSASTSASGRACICTSARSCARSSAGASRASAWGAGPWTARRSSVPCAPGTAPGARCGTTR